MVDYGSNANVEILVWGVSNSDYDTKAALARTIASDYIDSMLNNRVREATPSSRITSAANLIAAAILASSPQDIEKNDWFKQGKELIMAIKGTISDDAEWCYSLNVQKLRAFPVSPTNNQTWEGDW